MADVAMDLQRTIGNTVPLKTLLWKEYRQNRFIVFTTLSLIALPYLIVVGLVTHHNMDARWADFSTVAAFYSLCIAQLAMALMGGNLIAGERADRSNEFLDGLPIPRFKSFLAKMLLVAALVAAIWLPNMLMLWVAADASRPHGVLPILRLDAFWNMMAMIAMYGFTFFGAAWFFSATMKSPVLATCGGILAPILVWTLFLILIFLMFLGNRPLETQHWIERFPLGVWYCTTCLVSATVCFLAGTWVYLRRVES